MLKNRLQGPLFDGAASEIGEVPVGAAPQAPAAFNPAWARQSNAVITCHGVNGADRT